MKATKIMLAVLLAVVVGGLMILKPSHAEIFKWVDEKGTVHFTEDPATIPEKYREKVKARIMEETPMTPKQIIDIQPQGTDKQRIDTNMKIMPSSNYIYYPEEDPEYREMIKRLQKSVYYQQDIYYPGTQRIMHHAGEYNPTGAEAAEGLKRRIDDLVRNPEYSRNPDYRKRVKQIFESAFYEKDEYYSRSQSVIHRKGEIKPISRSNDVSPTRHVPDSTSPPGMEKIEPPYTRIFNPKTGHFMTKTPNGYFDYKTSQTWKDTGNGLFNPFTGERMNATGNGYIDPKSSQIWQKQ